MFDDVLHFAKVVTSALIGPNSAVAMDLEGIAGFEDDESDAEEPTQQEAFNGLGLIGRPLPADSDGWLETLGARTSDGEVPFSYRDLRINRAVNPAGAGTAPGPGQLMFAGYGGGFLSHSLTTVDSGDQPANIEIWYAPYEFTNGVPAKAHAIVMDTTPGNESISITHGDGIFVQLFTDSGTGLKTLTAAVDTESWVKLEEGSFNVTAASIVLKGNVAVGAQPELGVALLAGAASQPCPSLWLSPV